MAPSYKFRVCIKWQEPRPAPSPPPCPNTLIVPPEAKGRASTSLVRSGKLVHPGAAHQVWVPQTHLLTWALQLAYVTRDLSCALASRL